MSKKFVYIACPYTKGDVAVNVNKAIHVANELADLGFIPYVPIWTHFWHLVTPRPYEFWTEMDLEYVRKCDCILRIAGESAGADNEVVFAMSLDIPVYYSIAELKRELL